MRWLKSYSVFESKDLDQIKDLIEDLFTEVIDIGSNPIFTTYCLMVK